MPVLKYTRMTKAKKTGKSSSHYTTVVLPPCKVCSGEATGYHFGLITCEACKAFFRRSLIQKRPPRCKKNDRCSIVSTEVNCSACRLKKCRDMGMSKEGIRRGRFSLPLRTQAIVEANYLEGKASQETYTATPLPSSPSASPESSDDSLSLVPLSELSPSIASSFSMDAEVGLVKSSEMEYLIDTIVSWQETVYPNLKNHFAQPLDRMHDDIFKEFSLKEEIFQDVFGSSNKISTVDYQTVFAETGIDVDDRLTQFNMYGRAMEESLIQYAHFAGNIPGIKDMSTDDVTVLLRAAHLEVWFFGSHMLFNKELGVAISWDGSQNGKKDHMTNFFSEEWIDITFDFADTLSKLELTFEEIALIRGIVLTASDRCNVQERGKIQSLQEKYLECLRYQLAKVSTHPNRRLCKIFNRLLVVRSMNNINIRANKKFLSEWGFLMQEYPLWQGMLSYEDSDHAEN